MAIRTPSEIWKFLNQTVERKNGILNSQFSIYKNLNTKVSITCLVCDTNWQPSVYKVIHRETWCPHCGIKKSSDTRKLKRNVWGRLLENIQNKNIELDGDQTYINRNQRIKFCCKTCNHKWDTSISSVLNCDSGCPECSQKTLTINQHLKWQPILKEKLSNLMVAKKGTLLSESETIINTKSKVLVKCNACNTEWSASISHLLHSNRWCPSCAPINQSIKKRASANVWGRFLENIKTKNIELDGNQTYINTHQRMKLCCKTCNHKWQPSISSVLNQNSGCPECHQINVITKQYLKWRPITYQKLSNLMIEKNGTLLSKMEDFKSGKDRVSVKCNACNTEWSDTISHLLSGDRWCSSCASIGKSEFMMKNIIEVCLEKPFIKTRSEKWNTNPYTKRPLELDCYNAELKIAVEYDGQQHYRHNHWHQDSWKNFVNVNKRDLIKSNNCYKQGIILYRIQEPEKNHMRLLNDFPSFFRYIHASLESQGLFLPVSIEKFSKLKSIHHLIITNKLKSQTTFSHKTS